jgi:hypothetical protein
MSELPISIVANTALFVQLNDVYQINTSADYSDPSTLILPRIGTLVKRLREQHEHERLCLPGDFLAPSSLSKQHKGEQMIDVLNAMDVDLVSLGDHEFERDISAAEFEKPPFAVMAPQSPSTWIGHIRSPRQNTSQSMRIELSSAARTTRKPTWKSVR